MRFTIMVQDVKRFLCAAIFLWALTAPAAAREPVRIALLSDTHTNRGTNEDQTLYRGRLDQVIAAVNRARVKLVLIAGDLTQDGKPAEIADFKKQIKGFRAPVWFVPGNHDAGNKKIPGKSNGPDPARVAAIEAAFGPTFFTRRRAGVRVIGINSPILGSGLPLEEKMWAFLAKELAAPGTRPTILFSHYPLFVETPDEAGGDYWNIEPAPRARLLRWLKQGDVRTVLTGHLHRDLVNRADGILFVTTRPVSFGLPKGKQPEGWTLITLPEQGEAKVEFRGLDQ